MAKTDTAAAEQSQGAGQAGGHGFVPCAFDFRRWERYAKAGSASKVFAAGGRWLVSQRISHRTDCPAGPEKKPTFTQDGATGRWTCNDQAAAAAAHRRYKERHPEPGGVVSILPGGLALAKIDAADNVRPPKTGGGRRSEVAGFSRESKHRLMSLLQSFRFDAHSAAGKKSAAACAIFATLTYSDLGAPVGVCEEIDDAGLPVIEQTLEREKVKRDIDTLGKRLKRFRGFRGMLWKLEIEPRKSGSMKGALVPHFHLLLLFERPQAVRVFRRWLAMAWFEIAGAGDAKHRKAGTQALICYDGRSGRLFSYLGKYMGKSWAVSIERLRDGNPVKVGRVWGVQGDLDLAEPLTVRTTQPGTWREFLKRLRRWGMKSNYLSGITERTPGALVYGYGPELAKLLDGLQFLPEKILKRTAGPPQLWRTRCALLHTLRKAQTQQHKRTADTDMMPGAV